MKRSGMTAGVLLAVTLLLGGCAAEDSADPAAPTEAAQQDLLGAHGLEGMDGAEMIDHLDRLPVAERPTDLMAAVMTDHLVLTSAETEMHVDLPEDSFYLSIAPYVEQTHDCYYHSLTTCLGELQNEPVDIRILNDDGETLVEEQRTTFDDGFVGVWVPSNTRGTIEVSYVGMTGTTEFTSTDAGATCITDLQLA